MQPETANDATSLFRNDNQWYVVTTVGQEGPWARREDAESYLHLLRVVQAARTEMVGLELCQG